MAVTPGNGVTVPDSSAERPIPTTAAVRWVVSTGVTGGATNFEGTTVLEAVEKAPGPAELSARTRKEYDTPLVSPVTCRLVRLASAARS